MILDAVRLTDQVAIVTGAGVGIGREIAVAFAEDVLRVQYESNTPMARIGTPRDIAAAALYLGSRASSWATGVMLRVDGATTKPAFGLPAPPLQPTQQQETP
jgi:7-alpha-hydroxysteroid dehydrogenase